jgi:hypothetical protein
MSETTEEHPHPAEASIEAPEQPYAFPSAPGEQIPAAELIKQLSAEAHDRLGSVLESVASQLQGRTVNVTYANQKESVRISKYATGLHTLLTAFDNEIRNQTQE